MVLDTVRAIAVLLVLCAHLSSRMGDPHIGFFEPELLGIAGVVIFFVHSGCVNLMSIQRHVATRGDRNLFAAFMVRRIFRIYPLSCVVVAAVYFLHIPVTGVANPAPAHLGDLATSMLLVQNWTHHDEILATLWSLPYEIQLYLLFPLVFRLSRRMKDTDFLAGWAVLALVNLVLAPKLKHLSDHLGALNIPNMVLYILCFIPGFFAFRTAKRGNWPFWTLPVTLGALCIAWCLSYDLVKMIFGALLMGTLLPYFAPSANPVLGRVVAWVARYSYGIYLLHYPALWLVFAQPHVAALPVVVRIVVFLVCTLGGSVIVYHMIEHPMIQIGNRLSNRISGNPASVAKPDILVAP